MLSTALTPLQLSFDMLALPGGATALHLWSAEEPRLYLLLLSLVDGSENDGTGGGGGSSGGGGSAGGSGTSGGGGEKVLEIEACQVGLGS